MFCMIKAFSLVTGETEDKLLKLLDADPCEIIDEAKKDHNRYRGVYIDELQDVAIKLGYSFYCINPNPQLSTAKPMWSEERVQNRWSYYVNRYDGIMVGSSPSTPAHAVAWLDCNMIDPTGKLKKEDFHSFKVDYFLILEKLS